MLNLGSLVFGLIALILPIVELLQYYKAELKNWAVLSVASVAASAVSLCMQITDTYQRVELRDWSGLEDTYNAVTIISTAFLAVTIILNAFVLGVYYKRSRNR